MKRSVWLAAAEQPAGGLGLNLQVCAGGICHRLHGSQQHGSHLVQASAADALHTDAAWTRPCLNLVTFRDPGEGARDRPSCIRWSHRTLRQHLGVQDLAQASRRSALTVSWHPPRNTFHVWSALGLEPRILSTVTYRLSYCCPPAKVIIFIFKLTNEKFTICLSYPSSARNLQSEWDNWKRSFWCTTQ